MENEIAKRVKGAALTKSQRKIAEYMIRNEDRIGSMSAMEIAREMGVSDASIIRFARAIGFEGYADLKVHAYRRLVENAYGRMSLSERLANNARKYGGASTPAPFQSLIQQNLDAVFRDNPAKDFESISESIIKAKRRFVMGMRGCRGAAVQFSRLLSFMLPDVRALIGGECISELSLQDIGSDDTLLFFAFSRFYRADLEYMKLARAHGARICLFTDDITGPLTPYADMTLMLASANMSFYHSTTALTMASEYLLNLISDRVDYKDRIEQNDAVMKYQLL